MSHPSVPHFLVPMSGDFETIFEPSVTLRAFHINSSLLVLVSAERLELPFTASETGVLPVRRNGIIW